MHRPEPSKKAMKNRFANQQTIVDTDHSIVIDSINTNIRRDNFLAVTKITNAKSSRCWTLWFVCDVNDKANLQIVIIVNIMIGVEVQCSGTPE